ncbi:MAG: hypothetical protein ACJA06_000191 [Halocynthiibacter sp.]|jgi:hypothetical protein
MQKHTAICLVAAGLLAGCGASNVAAIVSKTIGNDVIVVGATPAESTLNAVPLTGAIYIPTHDVGPIKGWRTAVSLHQGYIAQSSSGGSEIFVVGTNGATANVTGLAIARTAPTTLPTSGSTTYLGRYAGIFQQDYDDPSTLDFIVGVLNGDVTINANFKDNTVLGTITNRELRSSVDNSLAPLVFPVDLAMAISPLYSDGSFSGITSGGQLTNTSPTVSGEYQGLISGAEAQEAIGGLRIVHQTDPGVSRNIEVGVFLAE